jgi:hypothetical protein
MEWRQVSKILSALILAITALATTFYWWQYPHLTEMQVFQTMWREIAVGALLSLVLYWVGSAGK